MRVWGLRGGAGWVMVGAGIQGDVCTGARAGGLRPQHARLVWPLALQPLLGSNHPESGLPYHRSSGFVPNPPPTHLRPRLQLSELLVFGEATKRSTHPQLIALGKAICGRMWLKE